MMKDVTCSGELRPVDYHSTAARVEEFVRDWVSRAGARGVALGLSGGIDSAVTAYLCCRALGKDRCLALIMPNSALTPASETADGMRVAELLGMTHRAISIGRLSDIIVAGDVGGDEAADRIVGNLNARLRAVLLYYEAQKRNYLVVGTDDKSEHLIGYFTKYGDGACDILPIAGLYKSEVWEMARFLGVPDDIIQKEPSPHLWPNHLASQELGMDYSRVDRALWCILEGSQDTSVPRDDIRRVRDLHRASEHKRRPPPVAEIAYL